jgi:hypothetical protein
VSSLSRHVVGSCLIALVLAGGTLVAQTAHKSTSKPAPKPAMTNDDVIKMVQSKLPESVVISSIQSQKSTFHTSANDLIKLQNAGVTEAEMNAMLAASAGRSQNPSPALAAAGAPDPVSAAETATPAAPVPEGAPAPATKSRLPQVALLSGGSSQELPLEKTQLAQTKTKPTSMKSLAGDSTLTQAFQAGITTATTSVASHIRSSVGTSSVQQAGSIFSNAMAHRKPTVTYVWGVPSPVSANVLQTVSPTFSIDFSRMPAVNADDYEPQIVKLTPAQNTCRIVGATEGKQDANSDPASDWQVYSHFLEERVSARAQRVAPGKYRLSPANELAPGEYAVVFRPVSKAKGFSGGDVARAQGDGLMFDAVWTFQIADSAQ